MSGFCFCGCSRCCCNAGGYLHPEVQEILSIWLFLPLFRNNTSPQQNDTTGTRPGASEVPDREAEVARPQEHSTVEHLDETVRGDHPTGVSPVLSDAITLEQEGRGFHIIVGRDTASPMSDGGGGLSGVAMG